MDENLSEHIYRMQAIDRALRIPSVNYVWCKSTEVYSRVKGTNSLVNWAFGTFENVVSTVLEKSMPVTKLMERSIYTLDKSFCQGLDFVEAKLPIIKEEPNQILYKTKNMISQHLQPAVQTYRDVKQETKLRVSIMKLRTYHKAYHLRRYSWQQADKVMSTETGISILKTVDNTTEFAELMLDKYLPAPYDEYEDEIEEDCIEHAKLHHTMIRLSEFSNRASRRISFAIMEHLQHMYKIEILILVLHAFIIIQVIRFVESIITFTFKLFSDYLIT